MISSPKGDRRATKILGSFKPSLLLLFQHLRLPLASENILRFERHLFVRNSRWLVQARRRKVLCKRFRSSRAAQNNSLKHQFFWSFAPLCEARMGLTSLHVGSAYAPTQARMAPTRGARMETKNDFFSFRAVCRS